jgi:acetyl-CoA carboxylase biotin carboxyl carrier protein
MNLETIERLLKLMQQYDLGELQVKEKELEFQARRGEKPQAPIVVSAPALGVPAMQQAAPIAVAGVAPKAPLEKNLKEIPAPIVGTFYRAPAPDQLPFKEVGDRVNADDVVCIIEAMKVMNEIKAGVNGTIKKLLVENATPVEYGQALFLVEVG